MAERGKVIDLVECEDGSFMAPQERQPDAMPAADAVLYRRVGEWLIVAALAAPWLAMKAHDLFGQ